MMPRRHGRWPTSWGRRTSTGGRRRWRGCGTASSRSGWSGPLSRSTPVPVDRRGLLEPRRAARSHLGAVRGPPSLAVSLVCPAVRGRHVPADPRRRDRREDRAGVGGREPAGVRHTHRPVVRTPRPGPSPTPPTRPAATTATTSGSGRPPAASEALSVHIDEVPPGGDGTLFTTRFGTPYRHDYYGTRIFAEAVAKSGLPPPTTSHDLRHHYASVLLAQGESVVAVAERLAHHNAWLVLSTYGHLRPDSEDRTRRTVDNAWASCAPFVPHDQGAGR